MPIFKFISIILVADNFIEAMSAAVIVISPVVVFTYVSVSSIDVIFAFILFIIGLLILFTINVPCIVVDMLLLPMVIVLELLPIWICSPFMFSAVILFAINVPCIVVEILLLPINICDVFGPIYKVEPELSIVGIFPIN
jgi:hypothetical protein